MAAAFLAFLSLELAVVVVVLLLALMTAHTLPLSICKEVSGGGEGGS